MANVVTVWSEFYITNAGLRLRQQSIAEGKPITFAFAKIGQGTPDPQNIPDMNDLVLEAERASVVRSEANDVTHHIGIRIDNKDFAEPVLMTEIGVFAFIGEEEPIMYGYSYTTQGYDSIPAGAVTHYVWTVGADTVISRAKEINFSYDGSEVYATEEELDSVRGEIGDLKSVISCEQGTVTLTNSLEYPFNSSLQTVSLQKERSDTLYSVFAEVVEADGNAGQIQISDCLENGFKIAFTGSAQTVKVNYKVMGGFTDENS